MVVQLSKALASTSSHTLFGDGNSITGTELMSAEPLEDLPEASSSEESVDLSCAQACALVHDAFKSASTQLHSPSDDGILEPIEPPAVEMISSGSAIGPQSPQLVEIKLDSNARTERSEKQYTAAEPQKAARGSYLYIPGVGFVYQEDGDELGYKAPVTL
ncbi:hypothetical protein ISF_00326 [Cordyceps fumosorosea ARSEF 2679]|uniref:Uncharacterized protein n=1 Tax=Cordyceps fumosorosea (strain ARSEF 2679) TaxID=1081104 RepID=A0A168E680_CORFA|nr:hypothetical protein ISF_00326 [Cordyceps fumosorosea ARSEF 2679]OAA73425.1 hypothetical protein ISF_00326 [Cordyceps fumosorosea ARSEF 2679]